MNSVNENGITFHRIDNDTNGNPRYVFHYLTLSHDYDEVVRLAKTIGGKRYRAKWYGGGIVISTYSLSETARELKELATN